MMTDLMWKAIESMVGMKDLMLLVEFVVEFVVEFAVEFVVGLWLALPWLRVYPWMVLWDFLFGS